MVLLIPVSATANGYVSGTVIDSESGLGIPYGRIDLVDLMNSRNRFSKYSDVYGDWGQFTHGSIDVFSYTFYGYGVDGYDTQACDPYWIQIPAGGTTYVDCAIDVGANTNPPSIETSIVGYPSIFGGLTMAGAAVVTQGDLPIYQQGWCVGTNNPPLSCIPSAKDEDADGGSFSQIIDVPAGERIYQRSFTKDTHGQHAFGSVTYFDTNDGHWVQTGSDICGDGSYAQSSEPDERDYYCNTDSDTYWKVQTVPPSGACSWNMPKWDIWECQIH